MIAYKLLNPDLTTYGGCRWVVGKKKMASGTGQLCGPGWLHGYEYAELAHFLNPIHAAFHDPILYRVEAGGRQLRDGVLKSGWTEMSLLEPVSLPVPTTEQRVRFAIACTVANYHHPHYINWATRWLNGDDRSPKAAKAAELAAWAAEAAEAAAEWAAVDDGTPIVQAVKFALSADLYPPCLRGGDI